MSDKALKFLKTTIEQDKLFETITDDIKNIIKPYEFEKAIFVENHKVGEITIELQDPIPSKLIKELDNYMGLECVILRNKTYHLDLIYKI